MMATNNAIKLSPQDKLAAGRLYLVKQCPYMASALLGLVPCEAPGLGTMGVTDSMILLWDPEYVDGLTVEETGAVLCHEVWHPLRDHAERTKALGIQGNTFTSLEGKLWNIAEDCEINDDLIDGGWKLPGMYCHPHREDLFGKKVDTGLTAEAYYDMLREEQAKQEQQAGDDSCEGDGPDGEGGGEGGDQEGDGQGQGAGDPKPDGAAKGWCGSGAGRALPGEPDAKEARGRSTSEIARLRQEVANAIAEHVASKGIGSMPAGWARWAEQQMKPAKIPWRSKLARTLRSAVAYRAGAVDFKYNRPSRRQGGIGFGPGKPLLPCLRAPVPQVACVLDTSGSMGDAEVLTGLSEINGVLKAVGAEVEFMANDAAVHAVATVRRWQDLTQHVRGGGGTSFCPPFEMFEKRGRGGKKPRPSIVIFVTDGMGPAPDAPPAGITTVWVLVGPKAIPYGANSGQPITWGEFIEVDE